MKPPLLFTVILLFAVAGGATVFGIHQRARAGRAQSESAAIRMELASLRQPPPQAAEQPWTAAPALESAFPVPNTVPEQDNEEELAALRARIAQLEGIVHARDQSIRSLQTQAATVVAPPASSPPEAPDSGRGWMENLRENDPERYQMVLQRRSEARESLQGALEDRSEFLFARERPWVGPESVGVYAEMAEVIEETWALSEAIDTEGLSRDERRELRSNLMQNLSRLGPMLETERDREFHSLAVAFGYNEEEAVQFVDYLNQVNELTSLRPLYQSLWGGRGGGR